MGKSTKLLKRFAALFLVVFMSIDSFAAIVSDNDGSAFITKKEFEDLKEEFADQVNKYNKSIDYKIDGSIANYLNGINVSKHHETDSVLSGEALEYAVTFNSANPLNYVFGWPRIRIDVTQTRWWDGQRDNIGTANVTAEPIAVSDATKISKTLITKLARKDTSSPWTAEWAGYRINCSEVLEIYAYYSSAAGIDGNPSNIGLVNATKQNDQGNNINLIKNQDLMGKSVMTLRTCVGTDRGTGSSPLLANATCKSINHDWGVNKYPIAICWQPYNYDMFSNYDRDYNWGYDGTYMTSFKSYSNPESWTLVGQDVHSYLNKTSATPKLIWMYQGGTSACNGGSKDITYSDYMVNYAGSSSGKMYVPMIGFERNYLTNWSQIYLPDTEEVADFDRKEYSTSITGSIIQTSDTEFHLSLSAGLPIVKLNLDEELSKFDVDFEDDSKNYIIWVSDRPFPSNKDPKDASNLVELTKLTKVNALNGYKVENGHGSFGYTNKEGDEKYLYMKWGILNAAGTSATCGGAVRINKTYIVVGQ